MARFLLFLGLVSLSLAIVVMAAKDSPSTGDSGKNSPPGKGDEGKKSPPPSTRENGKGDEGKKSPPGEPPVRSPAPSPAPKGSDDGSPPPEGSNGEKSPPGPPSKVSPPPKEPPTSPPMSPSNPPPPPPITSSSPPPPPTKSSPPPTSPPTSPSNTPPPPISPSSPPPASPSNPPPSPPITSSPPPSTPPTSPSNPPPTESSPPPPSPPISPSNPPPPSSTTPTPPTSPSNPPLVPPPTESSPPPPSPPISPSNPPPPPSTTPTPPISPSSPPPEPPISPPTSPSSPPVEPPSTPPVEPTPSPPSPSPSPSPPTTTPGPSTSPAPPPCDEKGSVCHDPRFVGGDGVLFYFHGKKDSTFCIFSDDDLHVNAYFIGKSGGVGRKRDFTWVKSLGIMFGEHQLYLGANKVTIWNDTIDQVSVVWDNVPITLPTRAGASWIESRAGIQIKRNTDVNSLSVLIDGLLALEAKVVPITNTESRIHQYDIPVDDCFAHLDLNFKFYHISELVHGVLGQTYAPSFINPVDRTLAMPIMGGDASYMTSSLMAPDCKVARFGSIGQVVRKISDFPVVQCSGRMGGGSGIVCRR